MRDDPLTVLATETSSNGARPRTSEDEPLRLFRRWSMPELLAEPDEFAWLIRGLLAEPTYGQIAGEMKTLKSYVGGFIAVGLAAGVPIFGRFTPPEAKPVLVYVGEGGRTLWTRRIRRIARAMGIDPDISGLEVSFDVAPIGSPMFQESLRRDLDELQPGLLLADPYYTFHGTATRASDLHQEGSLLTQLSAPCMEADASLLVTNHYNQTGTGMSLKRITMAGSGEWADSWLLLAHREAPDVEVGRFQLTLEVGSRQWGGRSWELDLDIGHFDEDTGTHDGEITWDLRPAAGSGTQGDTGRKNSSVDKARHRILEALADQPWKLTKTELRTVVGGNRDSFHKALNDLIDSDRIVHDKRRRNEAGIEKTRPLWGLTSTPPTEDGTGWGEDEF